MPPPSTKEDCLSRLDRYGFAPDRARTTAIDKAVRRRLIESVEIVLERARHAVCVSGDLGAWVERVETCERVPPSLWGRYHDLVQAALRDDLEAVERLAAEILAFDASDHRVGNVVTVSRGDLGAEAERYIRLVDSDPARPIGLVPVDPAETTRIAALVAEARPLLDETCPALLDEMDGLGHQIVLATSAGPRTFGGAATVFLWGAVILNPDRVPDRVTLIEGLAHETAHALLFGMTLGADLTTNDSSERYASPLRPDPRPIEGIVHATYVLARMVFALMQIRGSKRLDDAERARIEAKIARNLEHYAAGLETVDAHARFTEDGAAIFDACREAVAPCWRQPADPAAAPSAAPSCSTRPARRSCTPPPASDS